jgi:hypothetical protein
MHKQVDAYIVSDIKNKTNIGEFSLRASVDVDVDVCIQMLVRRLSSFSFEFQKLVR